MQELIYNVLAFAIETTLEHKAVIQFASTLIHIMSNEANVDCHRRRDDHSVGTACDCEESQSQLVIRLTS